MPLAVHSFSIIGAQKEGAASAPEWVSEDSTVRRSGDRIVVDFERGAETPEAAVDSALEDMRRSGLRIIRVDA